MSTGLTDARARSAASRPMASGVDQRGIDRHLLRVARPVVGPHGHGEELGAGSALGRADALRCRDGDRLGLRGERAEGGHAGVVRGSDHRAGPLGAELRAGARGPVRPGDREWFGGARFREARPVRELLDVGGDGRGALDQGPDPCVVHAAGAGDAHAAADHEPQVDEDLAARDVLVDLAVGKPRERGIARNHERLGLAGTCSLGLPDDLLRQEERCLRVSGDRVCTGHANTPTRTLRNRAPLTPWPTCPDCGGSPFPQFGVPHIRHEEASPTASIDRHSS